MRIGIDYTLAVTETAGIARHIREIVASLLEIDHENEYILVVASDAQGDIINTLSRKVEVHKLPFSNKTARKLWHQFGLPFPLEFLTTQFDVFHSPDFLLPPLRKAQGIVTIHDLAHILYPQYTDPRIVKYFTKAVNRSLERAKKVVAVSESTKKDIVKLLGVDADKIDVVYNAVDEMFVPIKDKKQLSVVKDKYKIDHPFILSIGSIQPRKNLQRLIEAYGIIHQDKEINHQLLLIGGAQWLAGDLKKKIEKLGLQDDVRFLGFVPDEDLPHLITLADVFSFPSLYEGFGIPPLEALACGTPVVSSNAPAMPEVLGDAAILVDPMNINALAEALKRSLLDKELRSKLVKKGLKRSKIFTWENAAKKQLEVYQKAGQS
ncbi:glycosyltransferase family 4 protein [Chloroflexota bacterium]